MLNISRSAQAIGLVLLFVVLAFGQTVKANVFAEVKKNDWVLIAVDPVKGSDANDLKSRRPLKTLKEAVKRANALQKPTRIQLQAGVYREGGITINKREVPIVIECLKGEAVISGADVWTDWEKKGKYYVADWPYDWGMASLNGYPEKDKDTIKDVGLRSEMVFIDDVLLQQVMTEKELKPGTYMVDEKKNKLFMVPFKKTNMKKAIIEVSVRPNLLNAYEVQGLMFRNLAFVKACNGNQHPGRGSYALLIAGEHVKGEGIVSEKKDRNFLRDLIIDNCRFEWNNTGGMTMAAISGGSITNSKFNNNGTGGVGANRIIGVLYDACEFNGNNWRYGLWGHVFGWAPAGTKQLFTKDMIFRRCEFNDNYATGLWLDFGNEDILVEDCVMMNNSDNGFYFEASYGPCILKNSRIINNGMKEFSYSVDRGGVLFAESRGLTIDKCIIAGNANFQVGVRSRERESSGFWSGRKYMGQCENLTIRNSVLIGVRYEGGNIPSWFSESFRDSSLIGRQIHASDESYKRFLKSYKGSRNVFYFSGTTKVFSTGNKHGFERLDLKGWQQLTRQDRNSVWKKVKP